MPQCPSCAKPRQKRHCKEHGPLISFRATLAALQPTIRDPRRTMPGVVDYARGEPFKQHSPVNLPVEWRADGADERLRAWDGRARPNAALGRRHGRFLSPRASGVVVSCSVHRLVLQRSTDTLNRAAATLHLRRCQIPSIYLYHLKIADKGFEIVVSQLSSHAPDKDTGQLL